MIEYPVINIAILKKHKGEYIQLGGMGILDGFKDAPDKISLYRIEEITTEDNFTKCMMHGYRKRRKEYLPETSFRQGCRIFTEKEWKDMPIFG